MIQASVQFLPLISAKIVQQAVKARLLAENLREESALKLATRKRPVLCQILFRAVANLLALQGW